MGMFDHLRSEYPLPAAGANELAYQTKDTDAQWMDNYVIRADGTLWHELYETEDHSDPTQTGLARFIGSEARVRPRWVQVPAWTGEIRFYTYRGDRRLEFSAYFVDGVLSQVHRIEDAR